MVKYRKKPIVVDAEIFTLGMEDGYASYGVFGGEFHGFFHKDEALPRNHLKPAIRTLEGWYEVEEGKHYIVTGVRGERYPVEKGIFEEMYDLVEDSGDLNSFPIDTCNKRGVPITDIFNGKIIKKNGR